MNIHLARLALFIELHFHSGVNFRSNGHLLIENGRRIGIIIVNINSCWNDNNALGNARKYDDDLW